MILGRRKTARIGKGIAERAASSGFLLFFFTGLSFDFDSTRLLPRFPRFRVSIVHAPASVKSAGAKKSRNGKSPVGFRLLHYRAEAVKRRASSAMAESGLPGL